jgi:hypothetical protein
MPHPMGLKVVKEKQYQCELANLLIRPHIGRIML